MPEAAAAIARRARSSVLCYVTRVTDGFQPQPASLHVCGRETVLDLRDEILRKQEYGVTSTLDLSQALPLFLRKPYTLILIDVEGDGRVAQAEQLCDDIRLQKPDQKVAFLCNHRVAIASDCPDEIIRSEFDPKAMIRGVKEMIEPETKPSGVLPR